MRSIRRLTSTMLVLLFSAAAPAVAADELVAIVDHYNAHGAFRPADVHPDDRLLMASALHAGAPNVLPAPPFDAPAAESEAWIARAMEMRETFAALADRHGVREVHTAIPEFDELQAALETDPLAIARYRFEGVDLLVWSEAVQEWIVGVIGAPEPLPADARLSSPEVDGETAVATTPGGGSIGFVREEGRWYVRLSG